MGIKLIVASAAAVFLAFGGARERTTAAAAEQNPPTNDTARILAEFNDRVEDYVKLRKKAAKDSPRLKETNDPAAIKAAQEGLAGQIRMLRAAAQPGDIFTAEVGPVFRRLLAPELKGEKGRDTKAAIREDAPPSVPLKINAKYPDSAPLPTVPANILKTLPPLPKELEYRVVQKHLILLDPEAEIIVDYLANAIR